MPSGTPRAYFQLFALSQHHRQESAPCPCKQLVLVLVLVSDLILFSGNICQLSLPFCTLRRGQYNWPITTSTWAKPNWASFYTCDSGNYCNSIASGDCSSYCGPYFFAGVEEVSHAYSCLWHVYTMFQYCDASIHAGCIYICKWNL